MSAQESGSIYDYTVKTIDGDNFSFSNLKNKKIMIVNVASKCGYTPQYKQLQEIYELYHEKGFEIIAFPANDFAEQEKGTNEEIKAFCSSNYGVSFPMMSKIVVKGKNKAPIYQWLTNEKMNKKGNYKVTWNFQKFLINRDGSLYKVIPPNVRPDDPEIIAWINE